MRNKFSYVPALAVGAAFGGIAVGAFDRCDREEELPSVVDSDMEVPEEAEVDPLDEVFCENDDQLSEEGLAMRPQPVCVDKGTSRLYADQGRFDALREGEKDDMLNVALTTFRSEMRRCMRKSKGKKGLEFGWGSHIDPVFSATITLNCGGDDEGRVDFQLTEGLDGFLSDNGTQFMRATTTVERYLADQIMTLSEFTDTYYVGEDPGPFVVTQRISVEEAGAEDGDGFEHKREFTYETLAEYEVAMGIFEDIEYDSDGNELPPPSVQERGPSELYALQGIIIDAGGQFSSSGEPVILSPSSVPPYPGCPY